MKSATIPPLRVDPALREDVESVLVEGETLSGFAEAALRAQVARRRDQRAFIERGLAAGERARESGEYHEAVDVIDGLRRRLEAAKAKSRGT